MMMMTAQHPVSQSPASQSNEVLFRTTAPKLSSMAAAPLQEGTQRRAGRKGKHQKEVVHKPSASITAAQLKSRNIKDYMELVETVARVEFSRLPDHLIDYSELVNIGALTLHLMFTKNPERDYNVTYLSTAMKWAVRNELRYRYKWYSFKQGEGEGDEAAAPEPGDAFDDDAPAIASAGNTSRSYDTILSVDGMMEADTPNEIRDDGATPEQHSEHSELARVVRECMAKLPERERKLLEARFFKHMRMREIGIHFNISPSRASRVVQGALNKVKVELLRRGISDV